MSDIVGVESAALATALQSKLALSDMMARLGSYSFSDPVLQFIWKIVQANWKKERECPPRVVLEAESRRYLSKKEAELAEVLEIIEMLYGMPPEEGFRSLTEQLRKRAVEISTMDASEKAMASIERGDPDGAAEIIRMQSIRGAPAPRGTSLFARDSDTFMRRIPTGLPPLDEIIEGIGYGPDGMAETGLVIGTSGMGKSTLVTAFGAAAAGNGFPVVHFDGENGASLVKARYFSYYTGIPAEMIEADRIPPRMQVLFDSWCERNQARIDANLRIVHFGNQQSSIEELESELLRLREEEGFNPLLAILDAPDHLKNSDKYKDFWANEAARFNIIDDFFRRQQGMGCWWVSQGKLSEEGKFAGNKAVAGASEKVKVCQISLILNPGLDPATKNVMLDDDTRRSIYIGKKRRGPARKPVHLRTKLGCCQFDEDYDFYFGGNDE